MSWRRWSEIMPLGAARAAMVAIAQEAPVATLLNAIRTFSSGAATHQTWDTTFDIPVGTTRLFFFVDVGWDSSGANTQLTSVVLDPAGTPAPTSIVANFTNVTGGFDPAIALCTIADPPTGNGVTVRVTYSANNARRSGLACIAIEGYGSHGTSVLQQRIAANGSTTSVNVTTTAAKSIVIGMSTAERSAADGHPMTPVSGDVTSLGTGTSGVGSTDHTLFAGWMDAPTIDTYTFGAVCANAAAGAHATRALEIKAA
jgi:hypothetical protein